MTRTPSSKIKDICDKLGRGYSIKSIDFENCIYKRLNTEYDVEVSGLDNSSKKFNCNVYLWHLTDGARIESTIPDVDSFEQLDALLRFLEIRFH